MLKIEKLSEKNLHEVLKIVYPNSLINPQKRINILGRVLIIDYEVLYNNSRIYVEFDGPTHYTNSKTQIRDQILEGHCDVENIKLIRIPYFIQINPNTIQCIFEHLDYDNLVQSEYLSGFHDSKIIYPANYNHHGWDLFYKYYVSFIKQGACSAMQDIWNSLIPNKDPELTIGIGWEFIEFKKMFVTQYPS